MQKAKPKKRKICLFGGTFDPIHLGHTYIASKAMREHALDKVIFLPCRQSPHKLNKKTASSESRLAMCQLATQQLPWAIVDDFELLAPQPSYSWRTAEVMQKKYPDAELYWLMGTDQWENYHQWARNTHLARLVQFLIFTRGSKPKEYHQFKHITLTGHHPASATAIRNNISSPQAVQWTHPHVLDYFRTNNTYHHTK